MRTSSPTVYKRPNPQDIYYNGNIYDPKPEEVKKEPEVAPPVTGGNYRDRQRNNPINMSNTGLQIHQGGN